MDNQHTGARIKIVKDEPHKKLPEKSEPDSKEAKTSPAAGAAKTAAKTAAPAAAPKPPAKLPNNFSNKYYVQNYKPSRNESDYSSRFSNYLEDNKKLPGWWAWKIFAEIKVGTDKENFDGNGNLTITAQRENVYTHGKNFVHRDGKHVYYKTLSLQKAFEHAVEVMGGSLNRVCPWADVKKQLRDVPEQFCCSMKLTHTNDSNNFNIKDPQTGAVAYRVTVIRASSKRQFEKKLFNNEEALQIWVNKLEGIAYNNIGVLEWNFSDDTIHYLVAQNTDGKDPIPGTCTAEGEEILRAMLTYIGYHSGKMDMFK